MKKAVLSIAYLPPLRYMFRILMADTVIIENAENYQKQSYRNRCYICSANGIQQLVIPVLNGNSGMPVKDVRIDNCSRWKNIHVRAIESAYRLSPYYEYYAGEIMSLYNAIPDFLLDWDMSLLKILTGILEIDADIRLTETFSKKYEETDVTDFRYSIHPKERLNKPDPDFIQKPYHQVFIDRYGFAPDMSIIDLIFNEGPYAVQVLKESIAK